MEFRRVLFRSAPHATFASAKIAARRLPMRTWFAVTLLMSTLPVAAQAAEITVDMQEADYSPAMVDAQVGDRILFVNDDVVDHEVFVRSEEHTSELQSLMRISYAVFWLKQK